MPKLRRAQPLWRCFALFQRGGCRCRCCLLQLFKFTSGVNNGHRKRLAHCGGSWLSPLKHFPYFLGDVLCRIGLRCFRARTAHCMAVKIFSGWLRHAAGIATLRGRRVASALGRTLPTKGDVTNGSVVFVNVRYGWRGAATVSQQGKEKSGRAKRPPLMIHLLSCQLHHNTPILDPAAAVAYVVWRREPWSVGIMTPHAAAAASVRILTARVTSRRLLLGERLRKHLRIFGFAGRVHAYKRTHAPGGTSNASFA